MKQEYDVIIVGGRIAGSVLAIKLGDAGFKVLLVEKGSFPSDTLSSHYFRGISALRIFEEIGILDTILSFNPPKLTHQVDFVDGSPHYQLIEIQGRSNLGYNLNVRRLILDNILNQRVLQIPNVTFMDKTKMKGLIFEHDKVVATLKTITSEIQVEAKLVVGADGRNSTVATIVEPEYEHILPAQRVMFYQYFTELATFDHSFPFTAEFSVNEDEFAYIFPTDSDLFLTAISLNKDELQSAKSKINGDITSLFENHQSMSDRIKLAKPVGKVYRSDFKDNYVRIPYGENWALIGDAAIHVDPWSGLGIDFASIQSSLLADHLIEWKQRKTSLKAVLKQFHSMRNEKCLKLYHNTVNLSTDMRKLVEKMLAKQIAK